MNELHDRINRVINTERFEEVLESNGTDLFEFQATWAHKSHGRFEKLPVVFQQAIVEAEKALDSPCGDLLVA